jgi:hypothetical protein
LLLVLLRVFNGYTIDTDNEDNDGDRVFGWGGVSSCPKVKFDFDHVHLSELVVDETRGLFEWSKLMLFCLSLDLIRLIDAIRIVGCSVVVPSGSRAVVCCNWSYGIDLEGSRRVQLASWRKPYFDVLSF